MFNLQIADLTVIFGEAQRCGSGRRHRHQHAVASLETCRVPLTDGY
jgi:hypothetical protein